MCGIAGLWRFGGADPSWLTARIKAMTDIQSHRGPDDEGAWVDGSAGIALGHRRLAIIDCSPAGHQPMASPCGRYVIVFNGEIYNYRALSAELADAGSPVAGSSDTVTLLAACARWGVEEALRRAVGMFAFALWDRHERRLVLARDRLGKKPLYWRQDAGGVAFGSQLKVLRAGLDQALAIDHGAFAAYCRFGYVPDSLCILHGVGKVPPGGYVVLDGHSAARPGRYWDLAQIAEAGQRARFAGGMGEAADRLEQLMAEAVRLRMVADVPLGAFLSGGVDSSAVVALMQAQSRQPVKTFSIGFTEKSYDESADAERVAHHLGTDHLTLTARPEDALELVDRLPQWFDEPFADSSQLPTLLLSRLVRGHVTVALSGDGGDELFAGYNRHMTLPGLARRLAPVPIALRRAVSETISLLSPSAWDALGAALPARLRPRQLGDKMHKLAPLLAAGDLHAMYGRVVSQWRNPPTLTPPSPVPPVDGPPPPLDHPVDRLRYLDMATYLPGDILVKVDRASMAFALEARAPLLDHRVVEFAWSLPPELLIQGGRGKAVLRRVLARHVPAALWERPKSGFAVPLDAWLRGPLRPWAEEMLSESALNASGLFDVGRVRHAWRRHVSGRKNLQHPLWVVLMAQQWRLQLG